MEVLLQLKNFFLLSMVFVRRFSLLVFILCLFNTDFSFFKNFRIKYLKYVPFSLTVLSYCGLCLTIMAKISMYVAPSSSYFAIGFLAGIWLIGCPIKYTEQLSFEDTTYRRLFSKKYLVTKIIIGFSCITYVENIFPLTVMSEFKNSIIKFIYPKILPSFDTLFFNFVFLFTFVSVIYYVTYRSPQIFGKILALTALIMVCSIGYFVDITKIPSNFCIHSTNCWKGALSSLFDGLIMSSVASDIFTFLSVTVNQNFYKQIKDFSLEEKKCIYATYAVSVSFLTTFVFLYVTLGTLPKAMINIFNQVDVEMQYNMFSNVIGYIYKLTSLLSTITVMHILYRETIVIIKILNFNKMGKILSAAFFLFLQTSIALIFSYEEISLISSGLYLVVQLSMSVVYFLRKKEQNISKEIQIVTE